jgi:hypothetical protein
MEDSMAEDVVDGDDDDNAEHEPEFCVVPGASQRGRDQLIERPGFAYGVTLRK